jgi:hypothetical protein
MISGKYRQIMLILLSLSAIIYYVPFGNTKADTTTYKVNIATSPAGGFLKAFNMAPGDQVTSILKVMNQGNLDFNYTVSSRLESGSPDLFSKLELQVSDSKGVLFKGLISGLKKLPLGSIAKQRNNNLTFTATLPLATNNATQGLSTIVSFDLTAVYRVPTPGCFEEPFSDDERVHDEENRSDDEASHDHHVSIHQESTVPIQFHLNDENGVPEKNLNKNTVVEVTGPSPKGGNVTYRFSYSTGTLTFDQSVSQPYYLARFSTFDSPVVSGQMYTATVYADSKVISQKQFYVADQEN